MAGKFEIKEGSSGKFRFNLKVVERANHFDQRGLRNAGRRGERHRIGA